MATGGERRPTGSPAVSCGERDEDVHCNNRARARGGGGLRLSSTLEDHVPGVIPRGDEITIRQLLQHRSGLANYPSKEYWSWLREAARSPASTRPSDTLRFAASRPLQFEPEAGRATRTRTTSRWVSSSKRPRDTRTHGNSRSASSNPSGSTTQSCRRRGACRTSTTAGRTECSLGGRRDRLERARPLPLLRASLRAHSVQCHARDDERDS